MGLLKSGDLAELQCWICLHSGCKEETGSEGIEQRDDMRQSSVSVCITELFFLLTSD